MNLGKARVEMNGRPLRATYVDSQTTPLILRTERRTLVVTKPTIWELVPGRRIV